MSPILQFRVGFNNLIIYSAIGVLNNPRQYFIRESSLKNNVGAARLKISSALYIRKDCVLLVIKFQEIPFFHHKYFGNILATLSFR